MSLTIIAKLAVNAKLVVKTPKQQSLTFASRAQTYVTDNDIPKDGTIPAKVVKPLVHHMLNVKSEGKFLVGGTYYCIVCGLNVDINTDRRHAASVTHSPAYNYEEQPK